MPFFRASFVFLLFATALRADEKKLQALFEGLPEILASWQRQGEKEQFTKSDLIHELGPATDYFIKRGPQLTQKALEKEVKFFVETFLHRQVLLGLAARDGFKLSKKQQGAGGSHAVADLLKKWVDKKIHPALSVSETEIKNYYQAHRDQMQIPERLVLARIFIKKDSDNASKKITKIAAALQDGASFAEQAKQFSEDSYAQKGGEMGMVYPGYLQKDIEGKVMHLQAGEQSAVIANAQGFYIFKCLKRIPKGILPLDTALQDEIRKTILHLKSQHELKKRIRLWEEKSRLKFHI